LFRKTKQRLRICKEIRYIIDQKKKKFMIGILILIAIVVLIAGYIAWESYVSKGGSLQQTTPVEETKEEPKQDPKPVPAVEPKPVVISTPTSAHPGSTGSLGVLGEIEIPVEVPVEVKEAPAKKRGRKPGTQPKDSFRKKGGKKGPKPKKDKGNDLLLS
jgi:cytoskeletal protein RodZ